MATIVIDTTNVFKHKRMGLTSMVGGIAQPLFNTRRIITNLTAGAMASSVFVMDRIIYVIPVLEVTSVSRLKSSTRAALTPQGSPIQQKVMDSWMRRELLPLWDGGLRYDAVSYPKVDRAGHISGVVKVLGIRQSRSPVHLYFRKTGALIEKTFTDANGNFAFVAGLDRSTSDFFVVAITEGAYNAVVFDKITPV